jgi:hypothetical protein
MNIRNLCTAFAVATAIPMASMAAVNFFNPLNPPPAKLSELGVYTNIGSKQLDTAMKYFEVNAALWSDGAGKKRWIVLKPGTHVIYNDTTDVFDYPDGAMFVKNFYLDSVAGDTTTRRYWETRVLVNKQDSAGFDQWYGFSYKWRSDESDADYVGLQGLDTLFYFHPNGLSKPQSYKKWFFPSEQACFDCHRRGVGDNGEGEFAARGVLGFLPPQLKRPAPLQPAINQVTWLFNQGVFTGTQPNATQLAARWKGLNEPIPSGLTEEQRFAVIDSMARSYIAANCSGCHTPRNASISATPPEALNYDWHTFKPKIEFGRAVWNSLGIENPVDPADTGYLDNGRRKYMLAVEKSGLSNSPFWTMTLPGSHREIALITTGFPAASPLLYRQFGMRRDAWRDSLSLRYSLQLEDPANLKSWIFNNPWGSAAWRADLASHGIKVDSLMKAHGFFAPDNNWQMPPLATNVVDTTAMRILGEWAATYRTLVPVEGQEPVTRINGAVARKAVAEMPKLHNRLLIVPNGWTGKAQMFSISGRAYNLPSVGRGQYAIPQAAPAGLYFFRVGEHTFRASVLK